MGRIFNCTAFSYPFGGLREVCQREIESAKTHGFTQAVSNMIEPLPGTRRYTSLFLPRLALPNSAEVAVIAFTLSGARYFLQHRRLLPQVHALHHERQSMIDASNIKKIEKLVAKAKRPIALVCDLGLSGLGVVISLGRVG